MTRKEKAAQFVDEDYNIFVTGRHVQVTDAMKDYAIEKVSKIERLGNKIIDINVTMDIQKLDHRVDIVLRFGHIKIKSHASSDNMYASIDKAFDKLQVQIRKYKTRIQNHHAKALSSVDMNVNVYKGVEEDLIFVNDEIEEENSRALLNAYQPHTVVSRETKNLKTLRLDEAIMKIELSGDSFLLFRSEEDRKLKLIYRRNDGNFGVIEPE